MRLAERLVREPQPKVGFSEIRIELNGLRESISGFVILIGSIKFFSLFDQRTRLGSIALNRAAQLGRSVCIAARSFISATSSLTIKQRKYDDQQRKLHNMW